MSSSSIALIVLYYCTAVYCSIKSFPVLCSYIKFMGSPKCPQSTPPQPPLKNPKKIKYCIFTLIEEKKRPVPPLYPSWKTLIEPPWKINEFNVCLYGYILILLSHILGSSSLSYCHLHLDV